MRPGTFQEQTLDSDHAIYDMAEQLCALYADKETLEACFPGLSVEEIVTTCAHVRDRLRARGERTSDLPVEGMTLSGSPLPGDEIDSLEAQLIELYAEREVLASAFPGLEVDEIVAEHNARIARLERLDAAPASPTPFPGRP